MPICTICAHQIIQFAQNSHTKCIEACNSCSTRMQQDPVEQSRLLCLPTIAFSLANTYFIPWLLGKDPSTKVMVVTYGDDLSSTLAKATKKVFLHPAYQKIFPHTVLENDNMQATRLRTSKSGHVIFTSLHGVMTGLGADWIILDDPIQAAHMRSEARLNDVIQVFKQSVSTRLNNPKNGKILLIQQRISPNEPCEYTNSMLQAHFSSSDTIGLAFTLNCLFRLPCFFY